MKELATDLKKDGSHQNLKGGKHIVRFPRLIRRFPRLPIRRFPRRTAEDVAFYKRLRLIAALETKAFDWIARGREANIELGRVFNKIKPLQKHGEWKPYFAKTFEPRGIRLRTAVEYMRLAREADEITKKADSALFPPATDPQAVEIREATERARLAVAAAAPRSSDEPIMDTDKRVSRDSNKAASCMCTCRFHIRMTTEQRDTIVALFRSEHRHSAEIEITDYLMELCAKHEITGSDSAEGHE